MEYCLFEYCFHTSEGGALYASLNGHLQLIGTSFRHCVTSSLAGAVSCTISSGVFKGVCFSDCASLETASVQYDNVFHAALIKGSSKSPIEMTLTVCLQCPKNEVSFDESIAFWKSCYVSFYDNNMSYNKLRTAELLTIAENSIGTSFSRNNFAFNKVNSVLNMHKSIATETSNYVYNQHSDSKISKNVIANSMSIVIKDSVFLGNNHPDFSQTPNYECIGCFFCSNSFDVGFDENCVSTLMLRKLDEAMCGAKTRAFTVLFPRERSLRLFLVNNLILL